MPRGVRRQAGRAGRILLNREDRATGFPRTLLLSWQRPDGRYAGAETLRKIVGLLPRERMRWAYLAGASGPVADLPPCRSFEPRHIHWRLRNTAFRYLYEHHLQAPRLARRIAAWATDFEPQLLWVMAELGTVTVGRRLGRRLRVPLHATVHDDFEFARFALPRRYYPRYRRSVRRFLGETRSVDAVSEELAARVAEVCGRAGALPTLVFPPSIRREHMRAARRDGAGAGSVRRLGLCGSMRIGGEQWTRFLDLLGRLPWRFEILAYVDREAFLKAALPPNVALEFQAYAGTEVELVRRLAEAGLYAAYLGITDRPEQHVFSRYSLSSKLTPYTAAALPVVVDGPEDSAAWRLIESFRAGIRCGADDASGRQLEEFFGDPGLRDELAAGAARLCREHFDLDRHIERFKQLLCASAAAGTGVEA